jgi:hypothetical protein
MRLTKKFVMLVSASVAALLVFCAFFAAAAGAAEWSVKNGFNAEGNEVTGVHTLKDLGWVGAKGGIAIGPKEEEAKEEFVLRGTVVGEKLVLKATKVLKSEDRISEEGRGGGKLIFEGLSVSQPANCTPPASITTDSLKFELTPVKGLLSGTALKFLPEAGKVLASFKLGGAECKIPNIALELETTNGLFGETAAIRTLAADQPVEFSPGINSTSGGNLTLAGKAAELTGKLEFMLTGEKNFGKEWSPE